MKIFSLYVGEPSTQRYGEQELRTRGAKRPVPRAMLRFDNLDDDGQADLANHGGADKAVCGRELEAAAFSENLTVSGALETDVCVGDVFRAGGATVQVSQPRMPCGKLAAKNGERMLARWISERQPDRISIADVNDVIYGCSRDITLIELLAERARQLRRSAQWV